VGIQVGYLVSQQRKVKDKFLFSLFSYISIYVNIYSLSIILVNKDYHKFNVVSYDMDGLYTLMTEH